MITTLNINSFSDINGEHITDILKVMFSSFGEIEVVIKPKAVNHTDEINKRIDAVASGAELLAFTTDEFDALNKQLLSGKKPEKSDIKKVAKR